MNNSYYRDSLTKQNHTRSGAKHTYYRKYLHMKSVSNAYVDALRYFLPLFFVTLYHFWLHPISAHTPFMNDYSSSHDYMLFWDSYFDVHFSVSYDFPYFTTFYIQYNLLVCSYEFEYNEPSLFLGLCQTIFSWKF